MDYFRFRSGYAKYRDLAMLVGYAGRVDPFEPPTKVIVLDEPATAGNVWGLENSEHVFMDVSKFRTGDMPRAVFVCLSEEGIVWFQNENGTIEDIADAGLWKETSKKYGYLDRIAQMGDHLFAWGFSGQVYRRAESNTWENFGEGLLDPNAENFSTSDICLATDGSFYAVTTLGPKGRILTRREETSWVEIENPTKEWLYCTVADKDGTVWIGGKNGTLSHGNAEKGFVNLSGEDDNDTFYSIALFEGLVWLCTNTEIYIYDGEKISAVDTGLTPPLRSAHRLQAIDGVLWSLGTDDIARYDGKTWQRFICPATEPLV